MIFYQPLNIPLHVYENDKTSHQYNITISSFKFIYDGYYSILSLFERKQPNF